MKRQSTRLKKKWNNLQGIHPLINQLLAKPPKDLKEVILPNDINGRDAERELQNSLQEPINSKRLKDMANEGDIIAIVASDNTRFVPQREMLKAILREISPLKDKNIFIVIANGTHKKINPKVLGLGDDILSRFKIFNHDARNMNELVELGKVSSRFEELKNPILSDNDLEVLSHMCYDACDKDIFKRENLLSKGIVRINKKILDADVIVLLGSIKPHYFAGYSGGVKSLIPGVVDRRFIIRNHLLKTHPSSDLGVIEGNLVREEFEEAAKLLRSKIFCLNVLLNRYGEIVHAVSGDMILAHRKGVEYARHVFEVKAGKANVVIISDTAPVSTSIKQMKKVVGAAGKIVKQNGVIIVVGDCQEGIGSSSKINDVIFNLYLRNRLPKNVSLLLISCLGKEEVEMTGFFEYVPNIESALNFARRKVGRKLDICVIPYGTLVVPMIDGEVT